MLPQSHFIAFNDRKSKHFSNTLREPSVCMTSCTRQPGRSKIRQDQRLSLHARKFCRPASGLGVLDQSRYSASIERVLVYIRSVQI